jgi:voltage-gated potassium channel
MGEKINKFKTYTSFCLNDTDSLAGKLTDLLMLGVNLLACALFVIGSYFQAGNYPTWLTVLEIIVIAEFIAEYLLRLWTAEKKRSYIFSFYGLIDLISIIPMLFPIRELGFFCSLRVLRILKFIRFLEKETFFFGKISPLQLQVTKFFFTAFTIIFMASGTILYAEKFSHDANIKTFGHAFYFCIITLSTVGYGDYTTVTAAGRWVTVFMIVGGMALLPWQAGKIARIMIRLETNKRQITCPNCGLKGHDFDASHCKACGHVIYQEYEGDA